MTDLLAIDRPALERVSGGMWTPPRPDTQLRPEPRPRPDTQPRPPGCNRDPATGRIHCTFPPRD